MVGKSDMNNNLGAYKWSIFCSMYAGYSMYMLDRKCFSFAAPTIMEEENLDKDDLGSYEHFWLVYQLYCSYVHVQ